MPAQDAEMDDTQILVQLRALEGIVNQKAGKEELVEVKGIIEAKFLGENAWKTDAMRFMTDTKTATQVIFDGVQAMKVEMDGIVKHANPEALHC